MSRIHKLRSKVLPKVDTVLPEQIYTTYRLDRAEYVGSTLTEQRTLIGELRKLGYEYNGLAAAKKHPTTEQIDSATYRLIPSEHPSEATNQRITRRWEPHQCQYHVHLFEFDDHIEVFSHYEVRPDIFSPKPSLHRLNIHYLGGYHLEGVAEAGLLSLVEQMNAVEQTKPSR